MRTIRNHHDHFPDQSDENLSVKKQAFIFMMFLLLAGASLMLFFISRGNQ